MAQNFINYTSAPYAGALVANNVGICTPSKFPPRTVVATIDWSKYPTGCVEIDLNANASVLQSFDFIRSIQIDNTKVRNSVQILFPDTNNDVSCPNDTIVSSYVLTLQMRALVFGVVNGSGLTRIFFNNFIVDTFTQENLPFSVMLGEQTSNANGDTNYNTVTLGRQFTSYLLALNTNIPIANLFGSPILGRNIVFTNIQARAIGCYTDKTTPQPMEAILFSNAVPINVWRWYAPNDMSLLSGIEITPKHSIQEALNISSQNLSLKNNLNLTSGFLQVDFHYDIMAQ